MTLLVFKILFLFVAVFFTIVNVGKIYAHQTVHTGNLFWHTAGIVGFITLEYLI